MLTSPTTLSEMLMSAALALAAINCTRSLMTACVCVCVCVYVCMEERGGEKSIHTDAVEDYSQMYYTDQTYKHTHLGSVSTTLLEHDVGEGVVLSQVHSSAEAGLAGLVDGVNGWEVH